MRDQFAACFGSSGVPMCIAHFLLRSFGSLSQWQDDLPPAHYIPLRPSRLGPGKGHAPCVPVGAALVLAGQSRVCCRRSLWWLICRVLAPPRQRLFGQHIRSDSSLYPFPRPIRWRTRAERRGHGACPITIGQAPCVHRHSETMAAITRGKSGQIHIHIFADGQHLE